MNNFVREKIDFYAKNHIFLNTKIFDFVTTYKQVTLQSKKIDCLVYNQREMLATHILTHTYQYTLFDWLIFT